MAHQPEPKWWKNHWDQEEAEEADPVELKAYLLRGRLNILEKMCSEIGVLDQFKFSLKRARKERDPRKLPAKVNQIEREVIKLWNKARPDEQMEPHPVPER